MRIIAGKHKGRRLNTPTNNQIRPTSDKVRQAIFNALFSRGAIINAHVIDGFCGTGALGLEALSQGAAFCTFFDKNRKSIDLCKSNIELLHEGNNSQCIMHNTTASQNKPANIRPADLVFLDPPYGQYMASKAIESFIKSEWIAEDCWFVIETGKDENEEFPLYVDEEKHYGDTKVIFAQMKG